MENTPQQPAAPVAPQYAFTDIIPTGKWNPDDKFAITGKQFEYIYNFFQMFHQLPMLMEHMFNQGMQAGVIQTAYEYPDGTPASEDHVALFKQQMMRMKDQYMQPGRIDAPQQPATPSLVDAAGNTLASETAAPTPANPDTEAVTKE